MHLPLVLSAQKVNMSFLDLDFDEDFQNVFSCGTPFLGASIITSFLRILN
jgi:hypothetical protein